MTQSFSPASRAIMVSAALVIVIAGMKYAAPLLVPFLLSAFIAVISFPLMSLLQQKGLPKGVSLTLVMLLVIFVGLVLTFLIGSSITDFSRTVPEYQQRITAEWGELIGWLNNHGISVADSIKEIVDPAAAVGLMSSILKGFGNVLTNAFLIILTVIFILVEAAGYTQNITGLNKTGSEPSPSGGQMFSQVFVDKLRRYMSMKTIISVLTGVIIAVAMWLIGVDYPVLWGVLAFMLNFVPNIGSIIASGRCSPLALTDSARKPEAPHGIFASSPPSKNIYVIDHPISSDDAENPKPTSRILRYELTNESWHEVLPAIELSNINANDITT